MKDEAKPEETPTETPTETPETTPTPETKTTEETKKSTSPKTGDNTPILFWILLAGAGNGWSWWHSDSSQKEKNKRL